MNHPDGYYSIGQVAEQTGMSTQLIRKWEQRYNVIIPTRLPNGYRVYTADDVKRLLSVQRFIERGYSVQNAILLLEKDPVVETADLLPDQSSDQRQIIDITSQIVDRLLMLGEEGQTAEQGQLLRYAMHEYGLHPTMRLIIPRFLGKVGDRWEAAVWSEYQEHLSSLVVRDFLVQVHGQLTVDPRANICLGTCLPGELHEIPVHLLLIEARLRGMRTSFLGTTPALGAIEQAIKLVHPAIVILSATTSAPYREYPDVLSNLDKFAGDCSDVDFYIGGRGAKMYVEARSLSHIRYVTSADEIFSPHR